MVSETFLPKGINLEYLLEKIRPICWGASDILLAYARGKQPPFGFKKILDVENTQDGPVSAADLAVNSWLLSNLKESFPTANWKVISEETSKSKSLNRALYEPNDWFWVLDPLDGTKDFLQGTGEYAVHLALVHLNSPLLGIVLIPELDQLWFGVMGLGTWCENRNVKKSSVKFSQRRYLKDLILVASRNHRDLRLEKLLGELNLCETKAIGSVGCKVASILRGETDLYISLSGKSAPKDWDMAAPEVILRAAGGSFTHADGNSLTYLQAELLQEGCIIASHGYSHQALCMKAKKSMELIDPGFVV